MIKVLIWFGMIAVMTFTLFSVRVLLRTGAEADERLEAIFIRNFMRTKKNSNLFDRRNKAMSNKIEVIGIDHGWSMMKTANKDVRVSYENIPYHIVIEDVAVFPRCYAAVVDKMPGFAKKTLIVDVGSWTIDMMPVINRQPEEANCITLPRKLITCMRSMGLIKCGSVVIPFDNQISKDTDLYRLYNTNLHEIAEQRRRMNELQKNE